MRTILMVAMAFAASCSRADRPASPASPSPVAAAPGSRAKELRAKCCAECTTCASRDQAGMDISGKSCTAYPVEWNGGPGVDDECRGWFAAQPQPLTVGDCRAP